MPSPKPRTQGSSSHLRQTFVLVAAVQHSPGCLPAHPRHEGCTGTEAPEVGGVLPATTQRRVRCIRPGLAGSEARNLSKSLCSLLKRTRGFALDSRDALVHPSVSSACLGCQPDAGAASRSAPALVRPPLLSAEARGHGVYQRVLWGERNNLRIWISCYLPISGHALHFTSLCLFPLP